MADLANHFGVSDFFSAVGRDIFKADEEENVSSFDAFSSDVGRGDDDFADPAEFVRVGLVPYLVEVWVLAELEVFECLSGGLVEDREGPFLEKRRRISATGGGMG